MSSQLDLLGLPLTEHLGWNATEGPLDAGLVELRAVVVESPGGASSVKNAPVPLTLCICKRLPDASEGEGEDEEAEKEEAEGVGCTSVPEEDEVTILEATETASTSAAPGEGGGVGGGGGATAAAGGGGGAGVGGAAMADPSHLKARRASRVYCIAAAVAHPECSSVPLLCLSI